MKYPSTPFASVLSLSMHSVFIFSARSLYFYSRLAAFDAYLAQSIVLNFRAPYNYCSLTFYSLLQIFILFAQTHELSQCLLILRFYFKSLFKSPSTFLLVLLLSPSPTILSSVMPRLFQNAASSPPYTFYLSASPFTSSSVFFFLFSRTRRPSL